MTDPVRVLVGDVRDRLADIAPASVQTVVTSPPYWGLRDYGVGGQLGLEATPAAFVDELVRVFEGVRGVLRKDGTLWVNLGDTYARAAHGSTGATSGLRNRKRYKDQQLGAALHHVKTVGVPRKTLLGMPWRFALAMIDAGWVLRSDVIWHKPNPVPESALDRPTRSHEHVFLFSRARHYFYDADAIRTPLKPKTLTTYTSTRRVPENADPMVASHNIARDVPVRKPRLATNGKHAGANARDVWTIASEPYDGEHFAAFPRELARRCIVAGSRPGDIVLDPFAGTGTTLEVAARLGRSAVGIELSPTYADLITKRLAGLQLPLWGVA